MPETTLVNEHFNDFPIDYFKINREFFLDGSAGGTTEEANSILEQQLLRYTKDIITPDENGRIYSSLREKINLDTKNTTVINASVGQGKTYSILRIVQEYYSQHPETYIFIAVPFVSLVEQYFKELIELGIEEDNLYRYEWLDPSHPNSTLEVQKSRRIHIVTVNCLLGNAGENSALNSYIKREYLSNFSNYLRGDEIIYDGSVITAEELDNLEIIENYAEIKAKLTINKGKYRKKAIFIYDEIHDAIHNFRKDNLFNLWHWQDTIHKNIIISATYNDASLVVIKYLSGLTDEKIHIIESERIIFRENQSKLHLHFNANHYYRNDDAILCRVIAQAIDQGNEIDILCYSKTLAEDIYRSVNGAGKLLKDAIGENNIKLCASELKSNQRVLGSSLQTPKYDPSKCNIGTNFKTGVNIEKENHSFIIIFPANSAKMPFENLFGIFSGGVNDIIQSLARQRIKGEIHLILPPCEKMDFTTLPEMSEIQRQQFEIAYNSVSPLPLSLWEQTIRHLSTNQQRFSDEEVIYKSLNTQSKIITDKFEEYISSIIYPVIKNSVSDKYKDYLEAPDLNEFRINKGNKILIKDKFLCADLSSFITYSAFTNQFINCRLAAFELSRIHFTEEGLPDEIEEIYNYLIENELGNGMVELDVIYQQFLDYIFDGKEVYLNSTRILKREYCVRQHILTRILKNETAEYFLDSHPYKSNLGNKFNHLNYMMYILQDIYHNKRIRGNSTFPETVEKLFNLREKFIETLLPNGDAKYLKPLTENDIFEELNINVSDLLTRLKEEFPLLVETNTFRNLYSKTIDNQKKDFYKYLSKTVGSFGESRRYSFAEYTVKKLESEILDIPYS
ncbi:MAG: DEAD/DEAH box helicase family protein [Weeksellaceae bacterium]|nr:DEAD/DEAH box helicase family protein [Bacteroidota bacterium]MCG2781912.1 DEAD/DEAH box helicase family protein [Weeksellaceae bacterium]